MIELLVALSISALLLTATMTAIDASFHAYATAAQSASTYTSTRLVMQRLLKMIRTSTLHGSCSGPHDTTPELPGASAPPMKALGIQMINPKGQRVRIWWQANPAYNDPDLGDLWYRLGNHASHPLLNQVVCHRTSEGQPYVFVLDSRSSKRGLLLSRATIDLMVEPGGGAELSLENAAANAPIRLVGSTMPRRSMW